MILLVMAQRLQLSLRKRLYVKALSLWLGMNPMDLKRGIDTAVLL